ncbi:MAG: hypothetical protein FK734_04335 [Asgard group archaeon]|nr:hypothetical protein [Asgard group archaeon]
MIQNHSLKDKSSTRMHKGIIFTIVLVSLMLISLVQFNRAKIQGDNESKTNFLNQNVITQFLPNSQDDVLKNYSLINSINENVLKNAVDLAIVNDTAFVVNEDGFLILNISDLTNLQVISQSVPIDTLEYQYIAIENDIAYVIVSRNSKISRLDFYNITDYSNPTKITSYYFHFLINEFLIHNSYGFFISSSRTYQIKIYDFSDLNNISFVSNFEDMEFTNIQFLDIYNETLIVGDYEEGLSLVNITDVEDCYVFRSAGFADNEELFGVYGRYVFVLHGQYLAIFNITNEFDLQQIASHYIIYTQGYTDMYIFNNYCYMNRYQTELHGYNITDIQHPVFKVVIDFSEFKVESCSKIVYKENIAYCICGNDGLLTLNVSNANDFSEITQFGGEKSINLAFYGNYLFVADSFSGLKIYNSSQLWNDTMISCFTITGELIDFIIENNTAFLLTNYGLETVNITDIKKPESLSIMSYYYGNCIIKKEDTIFLGGNQLLVYNMTKLSNPIRTQIIGMSYEIDDVLIYDDYLLTSTDYTNEITVFDINDINNVEEVSSFEISYFHTDLLIYTNYLFVTTEYYEGLRIYDLTDIYNPELTLTRDLYSSQIAIRNELLFSTIHIGMLDIFNLSDISNPAFIKSTIIEEIYYEIPLDLFVDENNTIFVVGSDHGIRIYGPDNDSDLLPNYLELNYYYTDPNQIDTDFDQMTDGYEARFSLDPLNGSDASIDYDYDGLLNIEEFYNMTHPICSDTDSDAVNDGDEISIYNCDPLLFDTDTDGLEDGHEIFFLLTDPLNYDTDSDNLDDFNELFIWGTDPFNNDTDSDGMPDGFEVYGYLDPLDPSDRDLDLDFDGLTNYEEFLYGTNPHQSDTDGDYYSDYEEILYGTDPLDPFDFPDLDKEVPTTSYQMIGFTIILIPLSLCFLLIIQFRRNWRKK